MLVHSQVDMANLTNEQQVSMFKAQEQVNAILSDTTAAANAAKQFNATSQNQTDQFFASMATQVSQFNTEQVMLWLVSTQVRQTH